MAGGLQRIEEEDGRSYYRRKKSMNDIRFNYGSQVFGADGSETSWYCRIGTTA